MLLRIEVERSGGTSDRLDIELSHAFDLGHFWRVGPLG